MKVLYIAFNNGTDVRISKELLHLSRQFEVFFLGLGLVAESDYIPDSVKSFKIDHKHKSIVGILLLNIYIIYLRLRFGIKNAYIVDEQCYFVTWVSLLGMNKIIDIFDSIFLKINMESEKLFIIKNIIYNSVDMLILTDEYRRKLLPAKFRGKAIIYPNYPSSSNIDLSLAQSSKAKSIGHGISMGLFGSISKDRGAEIAKRLLDFDSSIKLIMGGWLYDDYAKSLSRMDRVRYVGVLPQKNILQLMSLEVNLLLAYYPNSNINNRYASPNKLYDSILTSVPILINSYPMVSEKVRNMNIGLVIDESETDEQIIEQFKLRYSQFICSYDKLDKFKFTDESVSPSYLSSIKAVFDKN